MHGSTIKIKNVNYIIKIIFMDLNWKKTNYNVYAEILQSNSVTTSWKR